MLFSIAPLIDKNLLALMDLVKNSSNEVQRRSNERLFLPFFFFYHYFSSGEMEGLAWLVNHLNECFADHKLY